MAISEKWAPVFENEELIQKVLPMEPEDAQKVLAENGFDFPLEEILEVGRELYAMKQKAEANGGELDEDDLEDVAGGVNFKIIGGPIRPFNPIKLLSRW